MFFACFGEVFQWGILRFILWKSSAPTLLWTRVEAWRYQTRVLLKKRRGLLTAGEMDCEKNEMAQPAIV